MDHRADIYSLGAMLYHMLTGQPPFVDDNVYKVFTHHLHSPIPSVRGMLADAQLEPALDTLIQKMMSKEPDERPPSLLAVIEQIDALA